AVLHAHFVKVITLRNPEFRRPGSGADTAGLLAAKEVDTRRGIGVADQSHFRAANTPSDEIAAARKWIVYRLKRRGLKGQSATYFDLGYPREFDARDGVESIRLEEAPSKSMGATIELSSAGAVSSWKGIL